MKPAPFRLDLPASRGLDRVPTSSSPHVLLRPRPNLPPPVLVHTHPSIESPQGHSPVVADLTVSTIHPLHLDRAANQSREGAECDPAQPRTTATAYSPGVGLPDFRYRASPLAAREGCQAPVRVHPTPPRPHSVMNQTGARSRGSGSPLVARPPPRAVLPGGICIVTAVAFQDLDEKYEHTRLEVTINCNIQY